MTKQRRTFVRRPGAAPSAEALMQRGSDGGGIRFAETDLSRLTQRYDLVDLAAGGDHWKGQKRDSHGRFAKTGAGKAAKAADLVAESLTHREALARNLSDKELRSEVARKSNSPETKAIARRELARRAVPGKGSPAARLSEVAVEGLEAAEADPRFKTFKVGSEGMTRTGKPEAAKAALTRRDNPKTKAEVWHATPEERRAMLADNEADPLDGKSEAELFEMLDSDDPAERQQALASVEARRKRIDLLAEAAVDAVDTRRLKESLSKWDERVSRVPGGKAVVKWKNRLAKEETVVQAKKAKHTTKETLLELGIHGAIGSAIIGLGALASGYASMKYGGDASAFQSAVYDFNHLIHGGPKIGHVPLNEAFAWVAGAGAIKMALAHRAALRHPLKGRKKKKAAQAAALAAIVAEASLSNTETIMDTDLTFPNQPAGFSPTKGKRLRRAPGVALAPRLPMKAKRATAIKAVNGARRDKRLRARGVVRAGAQQRMLNSI